MRTNPLLLLLLISCLSLTSCSFLYRNTVGLVTGDDEQPATQVEQTEAQEDSSVVHNTASRVAVEKLTPRDKAGEDIEVVWRIPEDKVDGFVIHYGFNKDDLENEIKLESASLEKFDHPNYGEVYRHWVRGLPNDKTIYMSVSAFNDTLVSEPSKVLTVMPGSK